MQEVVIDGTTVDLEKFIMFGVFRMFGERKAVPTLVDGKFTYLANKFDSDAQPWRHFMYNLENHHCQRWHYVFYNVFLGEGPQVRFVPSHCQDCYKVVVKLKTWKEFMQLNDTMEDMNLHSKCGVEKRFFVKGLYGAYFYNRGIEEGIKTLDIVRERFEGASVILKRACTEFEIGHGPSDQWKITDEQLELEKLFDDWVTIIEDSTPQTEEEMDKVYKYWKEFAYKWDSTYDGEPVTPPTKYVQY